MSNNPLHGRFKDAPWYPKEAIHVMVGGAGGIGSWTAMLLARAGFNPIVYDFDLLEEHNLGGQLFPKRLISKSKVEALTLVIKDFCDLDIVGMNEKINEDTPTHLYCISAFDNMVARRIFYNTWLTNQGCGENPKALYIDGRLNAEQMQIFCLKGGAANVDAQHKYLTTELFDDKDVADAPCTLKQTSHAAAMIAAHIVGFFTNHITNVVENDDTRNVPYKWEYFIPMDLLDVQNQVEHELHSQNA